MVLLLPDEDNSLSIRLQALSQWLEGFLDGLQWENSALANEIVEEIIADFAKLKEVKSQSKSTKQNEKDYMEVIEFIKVAVLLVHAECMQVPVYESEAIH